MVTPPEEDIVAVEDCGGTVEFDDDDEKPITKGATPGAIPITAAISGTTVAWVKIDLARSRIPLRVVSLANLAVLRPRGGTLAGSLRLWVADVAVISDNTWRRLAAFLHYQLRYLRYLFMCTDFKQRFLVFGHPIEEFLLCSSISIWMVF
jgi:hypothetical protein